MGKRYYGFLLKTRKDIESVARFIQRLSPADQWLVEVFPTGMRRSSRQNARLWGIYRRIIKAQNLDIQPEDLHEAMLRAFCPAEVTEFHGVTIEHRHSSKMSKEEFADFTLCVETWAATELGVQV